MSNNSLDEFINRSLQIRTKYHNLEILHHGSKWSVEEDALAFLTDSGLVGRNIMAHQGRWPKTNTEDDLEHKLAESIWWLIVLANRTNIDIKVALDKFLSKTDDLLGDKA